MLEDLKGVVELLVFPEAYRRLGELLQQDAIVLVKGRLQMEENAPAKVVVAEIIPLEAAEPVFASAVVIRVRLKERTEALPGSYSTFSQRSPAKLLFAWN